MLISPEDQTILSVGLAQIAPVWLDRAATLAKVKSYAEESGAARLPLGRVRRGAGARLSVLARTDRRRKIQLHLAEDDLRRVCNSGSSTGSRASRRTSGDCSP